MNLRRLLLPAGVLLLVLLPVYLFGAHDAALDGFADRCDDRQLAPRHRKKPPLRTLLQLEKQACALSTRLVTRAGRVEEFDFRLVEVEESVFPYLVDSNSPSFREGSNLRLFNNAWEETYISFGDSPVTLSEPMRVDLPRPGRPGAVWLDPSSNLLYGWYHFEPADLVCQTAPIIGAAVSYDYGMSWEDRGPIINPAHGLDCDYENGYFSGGNGDFSVIIGPQGRYFYFLFTSYAGPASEQGIGVARSLVEHRGMPGTVFKYFNNNWNEPALGGRFTPLFKTSTGWKGPVIESYWGPSVHWNTHLKSYVALLNHTAGEEWAQEGIYLSFSKDLVRWTEPRKILEAEAWYPQVLGLGFGETDSVAGKNVRVYVGGVSNFEISFGP